MQEKSKVYKKEHGKGRKTGRLKFCRVALLRIVYILQVHCIPLALAVTRPIWTFVAPLTLMLRPYYFLQKFYNDRIQSKNVIGSCKSQYSKLVALSNLH